MRTETESTNKGMPDCPDRRHPGTVTDRGRISSRKYGRAVADAFSEPRCGMRCPDEPQLEQDKGHEQDGDTGEIAPALYQQLGVRGLARRELCRHPGHLPHSSAVGKVESCAPWRAGFRKNSGASLRRGVAQSAGTLPCAPRWRLSPTVR